MGQHVDHSQIPALWDLEFVGQLAHIHDLFAVPDRHLDEWVARSRPEVDFWVRNRAIEPILVRLVGREVLVGQVCVVVAVQARHCDLSAVVSDVKLAQSKG